MTFMTSRASILIMVVLLSGCAVREAQEAKRARSELVGLRKTDLQMCAGHPTNIDKIADGEIWMYEHAAVSPGGVTLTPAIPVAGASFGQGGGGYCRVQLRLVRDQVAEVVYAGATDLLGADDAACAPIVASCLGYRGGSKR
jgi:hypothetical protein